MFLTININIIGVETYLTYFLLKNRKKNWIKNLKLGGVGKDLKKEVIWVLWIVERVGTELNEEKPSEDISLNSDDFSKASLGTLNLSHYIRTLRTVQRRAIKLMPRIRTGAIKTVSLY
ncbi:hypothetical protein BpHYR1_030415 [Brachionus plicatilis]|uniref:Uncharacterized protein n=1 Tax=Brachionus plicatilis TaxID=10195 RepID=A0A3M7SLZ2_BRAPC|nr:hypothetical protein BpHYR1_030415 [Brachionus plicatilis]